MSDNAPAGLDQFLAQQTGAASPPTNGEPAGIDSFIKDQTHGSIGQEALTAIEGLGRGVTLGGSDALANAMREGASKLGVGDENLDLIAPSPADRRTRAEVNPGTNFVGSMAGGAALAAATGGISAAPFAGAAEGLGLGAKAAGYAGSAIAAGSEGAIFSAGNMISDYALGDPDLNAQKIASNLGMGFLLGVPFGLAGRALSKAAPKVASDLGEAIPEATGDSGHVADTLSDHVVNTENQTRLESEAAEAIKSTHNFKDNAPEIRAAAKEIGAPVSPGMVSADPWVQKFEDSLVRGAPTYSGILKQKLYAEGYEAAQNAVTGVVGEASSHGGLSKAQMGNALEGSLTAKIATENEPISQLYNAVTAETRNINIGKNSLSRIASNLEDLEALKFDKTGPAGALVTRMKDSIENLKTVDDVKGLRKYLSDSVSPTASRAEKQVIGEIQDRLKSLEENTITRHAEKLLNDHAEKLATSSKAGQIDEMNIWSDKIDRLTGLLEKKKAADAAYAPFINKIKTLSKYMGKKTISGPQGAIDFIESGITPEAIVTKLTQKNNSEFTSWFAKNFPEESALIKQYMKGELRDSAISDRTGEFDTRLFLKKIFGKSGLEKEQIENLFTPDEIKKLKASDTYLKSIPQDFNPSHTSHGEAARKFFESPLGATISNVRDFGIDQFIKHIVGLPPELRPNPVIAGNEIGSKVSKLATIEKMTTETDKTIASGAKSIFGPAVRGGALTGLTKASNQSFDNKAKRISELAMNPDVMGQHMMNHTAAIEQAAPNVAQSFQHSMVASVNFLNSKLPKAPPQFMLSQKWEPSDLQKQKFEQYYQAVQNPTGILKQIKSGTLTAESLEAVDATHPALLQEMRQKVMASMLIEKSMKLPYSVKLSLSKFLGEPLDSSMLPAVAVANQTAFALPSQQQQGPKPSASGISKLNLAKRSRTETQDLEGNDT